MTPKNIIILSLLHFCYGQHLNAEPGSNGPHAIGNLGIIDGYDVPAHRYPFIVRVISTDGVGYFPCGGTLIHPQFVLTAAHCIEGKNMSVWSVYLGAHTYNSEAIEKIPGSAFALHDQYVSEYSSHDIAIVKLEKSATLRPGLVETIEMAPAATYLAAEDSYANEGALLLGWGMINDKPLTYPKVLQGLSVTIKSKADCRRNKFVVGTLCITRVTGKPGVACGGDSGSPMLLGRSVIGVLVSIEGTSTCRTSASASAARVDYHRDWIDNKMKTM